MIYLPQQRTYDGAYLVLSRTGNCNLELREAKKARNMEIILVNGGIGSIDEKEGIVIC